MNEPTIKFKEALVTFTEKHPGHANQKVHNPKQGGGGTVTDRARKLAVNRAVGRGGKPSKSKNPNDYRNFTRLEKFSRFGAVMGGSQIGSSIGGKLGKAFDASKDPHNTGLGIGKFAGSLLGAHVGSSAGLKLSEGIRRSKKLTPTQKKVANALVGAAGTAAVGARYAVTAYKLARILAPIAKSAYYGSKRGFAKARTQQNYRNSKNPKRPDYDPSTGGPIIQGTYMKGGQLVPYRGKELFMITLKEYLDWRYTEKHPGHANQSVHAPRGGGGGGMGSRVGGALRAGAGAYGRAAGKVAGGYAKVGRAAGKLAVAGVKRYAVNRSGLGGARRALAIAKAGVRIGKKVAPVAAKVAKAGIKRYAINRSGLGGARRAVKIAKGAGRVAGAVGRGYGKAAKKVWGGIGSMVGKEVGSVTLKSYDGNRWTLIASGSFQDRDGEWLTEKGLRQWADSFGEHTKEINGRIVPVRANGEPVVLRWWHVGFPVPETRSKGVGMDLGICDFACYNSKSLIMSGTYNDPEVGATLSASGKELKGSIGFFHPKTEPVDGQFLNPDVYEVSYLPQDRASYPFSALIV